MFFFLHVLHDRSHINLETERNRVALELSELQNHHSLQQQQLKEESKKSLRESRLMLESVKKGAKEFSSLLNDGHFNSSTTSSTKFQYSSPAFDGNRSRGNTY